jgi:hypothetical protein
MRSTIGTGSVGDEEEEGQDVSLIAPVSVSVSIGGPIDQTDQKSLSPSPSPSEMSKLSDAVKALINAGHAKPGYTRAGAQVQPALERLASDARSKKVGLPAWVTVSVCQ